LIILFILIVNTDLKLFYIFKPNQQHSHSFLVLNLQIEQSS